MFIDQYSSDKSFESLFEIGIAKKFNRERVEGKLREKGLDYKYDDLLGFLKSDPVQTLLKEQSDYNRKIYSKPPEEMSNFLFFDSLIKISTSLDNVPFEEEGGDDMKKIYSTLKPILDDKGIKVVKSEVNFILNCFQRDLG